MKCILSYIQILWINALYKKLLKIIILIIKRFLLIFFFKSGPFYIRFIKIFKKLQKDSFAILKLISLLNFNKINKYKNLM